MPAKKNKDRATAYALAVVSGEIPAGPFVRGACKRHLNDMEHAEERGLYPDDWEAAKGIAFFEEILHLAGGQWEGKPFLLLPWQNFVIGSLYGWRRIPPNCKRVKRIIKTDDDEDKNPWMWVNNKTGTEEMAYRRFRVVYVETPKGSGKSPTAAGVGLMGLCADKEPRAAIFAAATKRDQAMILFRDAVAFVEQSPRLQKRLVMSGLGEKCWNLSHLESGSFFRVVSAEKKGLSGERPHVALLDEIHEHPDGTIIEQLRAGFKTRTQPIMFLITNSGYDKTTVCWEYHDMGSKIALEQVQNDEFFAYICSLDDEDLVDDKYLSDETLWPKVNPSLEYGLPGYDYIRSQVLEARGMPSKMATVKRLCFCQWTESENPAIGPEVWADCQDKDYPVDILIGRRAWGGLDLSAVRDLTAFALMFEPSADDPLWRLKVWFWVPGIGLMQKADQDHVPYIAWRDAGYITAIPRKTIEYEFVIKDIVELCGKYAVQKIAFDRWNKKTFDKDLLRMGATLPEVVEFGQGFQSMAPAIKVFETKFTEATMRHDGNPCLTWNASNVVAIEDAADNKKYIKPSSGGRIDGIIAAVMACGILEETGEVQNIYETYSLMRG